MAGGIDVTFHEPLGVVGLITPWNFPMLMASWKIGPALAAGNTAVLKPAEITPLTSMRLGELALEAGIPEGVLNVVVGPGSTVGWRLVEHPDVRKVAFTGSTAVGKRLMPGCADQVKRITLELGGKSANIVFADADLERPLRRRPARCSTTPVRTAARAAASSCSAACSTASSSCSSTRRSKLTVGDPMRPDTAMGPLVTADHLAAVRRYSDGLDTVFTGEAPDRSRLLAPDHDRHARRTDDPVCHEEIFGPVVVVIPFDDEADAIRICNDSDLRPVRFGVDPRRRQGHPRGRAAMEAGTLSVNSNSSVRYSTPFGGFKQSGLGREHSMHVLDHYTELKNVFFAT